MAVFQNLSESLIQKYIDDEKIYKELRKKYTVEEIAESMLIPQDLTPEEKKKADEELLAFRFKILKNKR